MLPSEEGGYWRRSPTNDVASIREDTVTIFLLGPGHFGTGMKGCVFIHKSSKIIGVVHACSPRT